MPLKLSERLTARCSNCELLCFFAVPSFPIMGAVIFFSNNPNTRTGVIFLAGVVLLAIWSCYRSEKRRFEILVEEGVTDLEEKWKVLLLASIKSGRVELFGKTIDDIEDAQSKALLALQNSSHQATVEWRAYRKWNRKLMELKFTNEDQFQLQRTCAERREFRELDSQLQAMRAIARVLKVALEADNETIGG